jgi:RNA polymerase sigma-70 factor (ECF subfamily)
MTDNEQPITVRRPEAVTALSHGVDHELDTGKRITALAMHARAAWSVGDSVGEQRAFTELIREMSDRLIVYARARIDYADAEDVVGDALVGFLLMVRSDTRIRNAPALLFMILKNKIVDRGRRSGVVKGMADDALFRVQAATGSAAPAAEALAISKMEVNRILGQLPAEERLVLYLRGIHDLSVADVAKRTGLTRDQVKKRTAQAIRHVKEVI